MNLSESYILVRTFTESSSPILTRDGLAEIMRYIEHDEYEIAFEGLVLELMQAGKKPRDFDPETWRNVGVALGLAEESVLLPNFWEKFQIWLYAP